MSHHDPQQIISRYAIIQQQTECEQHPGQVWSREDEESQEAKAHARVPARPDVDEAERQRGAEEGHRREGRQQDQRGGAVEQQPGEVGGPAAERRFLQVARVPRHEEQVEHEVERERAEVEERRQDAPILRKNSC